MQPASCGLPPELREVSMVLASPLGELDLCEYMSKSFLFQGFFHPCSPVAECHNGGLKRTSVRGRSRTFEDPWAGGARGGSKGEPEPAFNQAPKCPAQVKTTSVWLKPPRGHRDQSSPTRAGPTTGSLRFLIPAAASKAEAAPGGMLLPAAAGLGNRGEPSISHACWQGGTCSSS